MTVLEFEYLQHTIRITGSQWTGHEELVVDNVRKDSKWNPISNKGSYQFTLPNLGSFRLEFTVGLADLRTDYALYQDDRIVSKNSYQSQSSVYDAMKSTMQNLEQATVQENDQGRKSPKPWFSIAGLLFKLGKSGGAIKAALAGGSYLSWALLTDWRFAAVLILILVFHEYGHLVAMKRVGIATKGMYLIPFFGGVAIGERAKSYWHETYVSMMGPIYGLAMTIIAFAAYWITHWEFLGLVASFSALINLFNLLPIYPLDGGHVLKASVLSMKGRSGYVLLLAFSTVAGVLSVWSELYLLTFFVALGTADLVFSQQTFRDNDITEMDRRGIGLSLAWYFVTIVVFVWVIVSMHNAAVPGADLPIAILSDV